VRLVPSKRRGVSRLEDEGIGGEPFYTTWRSTLGEIPNPEWTREMQRPYRSD